MNKIKFYQEILDVLNKHGEIIDDEYSLDIRDKLVRCIEKEELNDKYGLSLSSTLHYNKKWCTINDYMFLGLFGEGHATIAWEDNREAPENETLLKISFPSGPYIFGGDYPVELFNKFFNVLKGYNPSYVDTRNSSLYYSLDNAGKVKKDFEKIFNDHKAMYKKWSAKNKIKGLEEQLKKLGQV